MRKKWGEHNEASTTIWGTDWYNMRKQQGIVNNKLDIKQTLAHIVHEASICRIWDGHYNRKVEKTTEFVERIKKVQEKARTA